GDAQLRRTGRQLRAPELHGHGRRNTHRVKPPVLQGDDGARPLGRPPPAFGASREIEGIGTPLYDKNVVGSGPGEVRAYRLEAPAVLQSHGARGDIDVHARLLAGSAQPAGGLQGALEARIELREPLRVQREFHDVPGLPEVSARLER